MDKVIAILGPTASGKTSIGIELAKKIGGEIISCDSMQVYKYMDIGTAKPTREEVSGIGYHLIDIIYPNEEFNAGIYEKLAKEKINEVIRKGKIPIIVGGTGLYFRALRYGLHNIPKNKKTRETLENIAKDEGIEFLYHELLSLDPEYAKTIGPTDKKRIIRALEVIKISGEKFSRLSKTWREDTDFSKRFLVFVLYKERPLLYQDIEKRVDEMIGKGLVDEVKRLLDMGYSKDLNALSAIGYKEIIDYLERKYSLEDTIYLIKKNTRHYAKRQFIWFRKEKDAIWIDSWDKKDALEKLLNFIRTFL